MGFPCAECAGFCAGCLRNPRFSRCFLGLFESIPGWMFFDYAAMRTDGVSVALNAVYARTLDEAARLERLAGEATGAGEYERRAQQVRGSLNRLCAGDTFYPDVLVRDPQRQLVDRKSVV